jgi:oligosaccharide repeat unit polymerase
MADKLMFWLFVTGYVVVFFFFSVWFSKTQGYLSAFTVFGIVSFYYYLALPIESRLIDVNVEGRFYYLDAATSTKVALGALIAIVSFAIGMALTRAPKVLFEPILPRTPLESGYHHGFSQSSFQQIPVSPFLFLAAATFILIIFDGQSLLTHRAYHERNYFLSTHSGLAQALSFFCMGLAVVGATLLLGSGFNRIFGYGCVAMLILLGVWLMDKDPILISLCTLGVSFMRPKYNRPWHLFLIIFFAVCSFYALPLFSFYRTSQTADVSFSEFLRSLSLNITDARGPMVSLSVEMNRHWSDFEWGRSYLTSLVGWIPRSIYPNRPFSLAERLAQEMMYNYREGMGLGYSLLAEGYRSLGFLGIFLQYFFLGMLWNFLWRFVTVVVKNPLLVRAMYAALGLYILVLCHRGPTQTLVRWLVYSLSPIIVMDFLYSKLQDARFRR